MSSQTHQSPISYAEADYDLKKTQKPNATERIWITSLHQHEGPDKKRVGCLRGESRDSSRKSERKL